jgi:hypothetical protein
MLHRQFVPVDDTKFAVVATQDVGPIIEANKAQATDGTDGYSPSRLTKHVARIPLVVAEQWLNDFGINVLDQNHKPAVVRLLNSSEWAWLRTGGGRI